MYHIQFCISNMRYLAASFVRKHTCHVVRACSDQRCRFTYGFLSTKHPNLAPPELCSGTALILQKKNLMNVSGLTRRNRLVSLYHDYTDPPQCRVRLGGDCCIGMTSQSWQNHLSSTQSLLVLVRCTILPTPTVVGVNTCR